MILIRFSFLVWVTITYRAEQHVSISYPFLLEGISTEKTYNEGIITYRSSTTVSTSGINLFKNLKWKAIKRRQGRHY